MLYLPFYVQFKEQFIKQGIEGGRKAAYALKAAILKECHGPANEIEVIAKVCVNLDGLARAMKKAGSLENEIDLKDFFLGFSQGVASFDIVDVGYGKGRVESKIQGRQNRRHPFIFTALPSVNVRILQRQPNGILKTITANKSFLASRMRPVMPLFSVRYCRTKRQRSELPSLRVLR
jgi:hypothetical protein